MATTLPTVVLGCFNIGGPSDPSAKYNTPGNVQEFLSTFRKHGYIHLDTARSYSAEASGTCEPLMGQTDFASWAVIDTKAESHDPGSHKADSITESINASLKGLGVSKVHIYYLHLPDRSTPFEDTCRTINEAYEAGKFEKFGLSNYSADEVDRIYKICENHSWVKPTVYQGQYNAIARRPEEDLFPTLRKYNISFYAFSPGAGGMFSGKITHESVHEKGTRWDKDTLLGQAYASIYLKDALLNAAKKVHDAAEKAGISGHAAALRWMLHHSALRGDLGDGMIIGASSLQQLDGNLEICKAGPLPLELVKAVEDVWALARESAPASRPGTNENTLLSTMSVIDPEVPKVKQNILENYSFGDLNKSIAHANGRRTDDLKQSLRHIRSTASKSKKMNAATLWTEPRYSALRQLAYDTVSCSAMGAECERIFDAAGQKLTPTRNSLHDQVIEASQYLKY